MSLLNKLSGLGNSGESQESIDARTAVKAAVREVKQARIELLSLTGRIALLGEKLEQHEAQLIARRADVREAEERKQASLAAYAEGAMDEKSVAAAREHLRNLSIQVSELEETINAVRVAIQPISQKAEQCQAQVRAAELAFWRALYVDMMASAPPEVGKFLVRLRACNRAAQSNYTFEHTLHQVWPSLRPADIADVERACEELCDEYLK